VAFLAQGIYAIFFKSACVKNRGSYQGIALAMSKEKQSKTALAAARKIQRLKPPLISHRLARLKARPDTNPRPAIPRLRPAV